MRRSLIPLTVVVLGMFAGHAALAQNGTTRRPLVGPDRPLAEKLRSPRETLQTLYYAVDVYDYFPQVIADAVACLDLGDLMPPDSASAALLAVQLEGILNGLDIPLAGVPDKPDGDTVTLHDAGGITVALARGADGLWRFDRPTVERIPAMRRTALARQKNLQAERAAVRENFTDARATMHRFIVDAYLGDFTAAARALDLSGLSAAERRDRGPALAQQLAFVLQRRGYTFSQLLPDNPAAPPFTWHADRDGRIILERVHPAEGKDAWLFSRHTVANVPRMYEAARHAEPDARYVRLGLVVPPLPPDGKPVSTHQRPAGVPADFGSPRALLKGFFRTMDDAETNDTRLAEAVAYLDLGGIPPADQKAVGGKLAWQLEAVLRKLQIDLATIPDEWDAPPQVLGEGRGFRVELVRARNGAWRFSEATVAQVPALFEKLDARDRADREHAVQFDTARDTAVTFLNAVNTGDAALAARCLDLSELHPGARDELGPALALKLKFVLDRIGRVYVQEIPDEPDGARYVLYRGELGRVVVARRASEPRKGTWLFTPETVQQIEPMFRGSLGRPVAESLRGMANVRTEPTFAGAPAVWLRLKLPAWALTTFLGLDLYQWLGLALAAAVSWWAARIGLASVHRLVGWLLRRGGSSLSTRYIARKMRPLTWLTALWLCFHLAALLDLPTGLLNDVLPLKKFLLAGLIGWFGCRLVDLTRAVYSNSELLKPHRSLGDMIAPVTVRAAKGGVVLVVAAYVIYQVGEGDTLGRFITGLGVAGLAASLAAQDALKSFFGTLLLIGERSFKIGDRIIVSGQEGVVEQVGFRSTRLRTSEDSLLTIPNSTIAAASIDNMGARSYRRYKTAVLIHYRTPLTRLSDLRDRLREWLADHPHVRRDKIDVAVQSLGDKGIELVLSVYLSAPDGAEETRLRD
jgi:MscS family membrane protein